MKIIISETKQELSIAAAKSGAQKINEAIEAKGTANIILATGASQLEMLNQLIKEDIDWKKVTGFHLDEYIDLPPTHPASFRKYLMDRFVNRVPIGDFFLINTEEDIPTVCKKLNRLILANPVDVAFVGIGENAHLAFNDPPADFETEEPFIKVVLDEACREQQLAEGWFDSLEEVPTMAVSMSVRQIMKAYHIICTVPGPRKAKAVGAVLNGKVVPEVPASILNLHASTQLFLDKDSAKLADSATSG
ncbi:glucosamine-6-phosphate deaminase [Flexithrix dorotheae]|uniref:glucosamine-6-phosphate deaminase n=1 Tax=Flexithrix dorotheae TaxID=70993 RepID=UPI0003772B3F|nr:glucosamine-6-phosphate deaminase [Flexithrix dorotheae]